MIIIYVNNDKTQGIKIQDYYSSYSQVEKLKFADESVVETSTVAVTIDRSDALAAQNITGTDNNDILIGGNFGDTLTGNDGDDVIDGGAGNDTLKGNSGNDTLIGGKGNDRLEGSYGDDTYIWNLGDGFDTIYDYNGGNTDNGLLSNPVKNIFTTSNISKDLVFFPLTRSDISLWYAWNVSVEKLVENV